METDIRVQLETDLDALQEDNVESWIQRCFEACDPKFESDWLSGMLELAYMQFPDNYEVRSACSRASVLEARRLSNEGDFKEAVRRLEQLLEADPYCTEGFELLEELSKSPEPVPAPVAVVAPVVAPLPPTPAVPRPPVSPPTPPIALSVSGSGEAPAPAPIPPTPLYVSGSGEAPAPAPTPPTPLSVSGSGEAPALAPTPPTPLSVSGSGEAPAPAPTPPTPLSVSGSGEAPAPAPTAPRATPSELPWNQLWHLPRHPAPAGDAQYLSAVAAMAEKMRAQGRPDTALRLLVDHREELQHSPAWTEQIKSTLLGWVSKLNQAQMGPVAAQVCQWGANVLPEAEDLKELAADLIRRFGLPTPVLVAGTANPWRERLEAAPGDTTLLDEIYSHYHQDPDGLLMLFRQIAVECHDSRHILNLGWAYQKAGTPVLALVHTQRALKLSPTRRGYQLLADIYEQLGQNQLKEAALRSLQETAAP